MVRLRRPRRVRRASLAHLRARGRGRPAPSFARFLPNWQNVDAHRAAGAGPDRLREALEPLQGVTLTPKVWEQDVLPRRLGAYSPAWLDELCTSGEVVWIGAGARGRNDGRVALYSARTSASPARRPPTRSWSGRGRGPRRDPRAPRCRPGFWLDLLGDLDLPVEELHDGALGPGLVGRGDQRRLLAVARPAPARGALKRAGWAALRPPAAAPGPPSRAAGRWSRRSSMTLPAAGPRLRAQAELMLERYGIVTRST